MNPIPEALRPELVAPITSAIIAADPLVEPVVIEAARTGMGMAASQVSQPFWPDVTLLWVVVGTGPHALVRYVAFMQDGSLRVLTNNPQAFAELAEQQAIQVTKETAVEYALFYLEVTRRMDCAIEVVVSDRVSLAHLSRPELVKGMLFGTNGLSVEQRIEVFQRLHQIRSLSPSQAEIYGALETIVDAMTDERRGISESTVKTLMAADVSSSELRRLEFLYRLPIAALNSEEKLALSRCIDVLASDVGSAYAVLLSESEVFGRRGFVHSRDNGAPMTRLGQPQTGYLGSVSPEAALGIKRCLQSGDVLQMDSEWGVLLTFEPPPRALVDSSLPPECWDDLDGFELMQSGRLVDCKPHNKAVLNDRAPIPFEWNASLYDVDGLGRATPLMKYASNEGAWLPFDACNPTQETEPVHWKQTMAVRRVLSHVKDGPFVRESGTRFMLELLVCRDQSVDLCQLLMGPLGTIHVDWSTVL